MRHGFKFILLLCCVSLWGSRTLAQVTQPLRVVVGFAPGGSLDTLARIVAAELAQELERPVVVENRPGANGNIAAEYVARGLPDGNTMLATFNTHPFLAALHPRLRFDPIADFRPVGLIASTPYLLVANPALPGRDLAEAFARAKSEHRTLSFGTVGLGSPQHLSAARLRGAAGVALTIVHYKGGSPAQNDVVAGHVDMMSATIALAMPQVHAGRLKVLAVSTAQRLPSLPNVPTLNELGFRGIVPDGWYGLLLAARTPDAVAVRYNAALARALATPALRERLEALGMPPLGGPPDRMATLMQQERDTWSKVIRDNQIRGED